MSQADKVVASASEAIRAVEPGSRVMVGGFGAQQSWPASLLRALAEAGTGGLTVMANTVGYGKYSPQILAGKQQIARFIGAFGGRAGMQTDLEDQILAGLIEFEPVPQGTLVERFRAGGAGIPAFYTPTGVGTEIEGLGKEAREFDGKRFVLETALTADVALLRATRVDRAGNCQFEGPTRNFQVAMASASKHAIVEATEVVEVGDLDPDKVHIPGIYVDAVVVTEIAVEEIQAAGRAVARDPLKVGSANEVIGIPRDLMALRAAQEIAQLKFVNLGIGIPTLIGRWLAELDAPVQLHAENGLLGYRGRDNAEGWNWNWYDAGSLPADPVASTSTFDSVSAFTMARGGHLDAVVLGGYEVAQNGDLANWKIPGSKVGGIGGAMDLIAGGSPVLVVMQHTTKTGEPRLLRECSLPLTGVGCVTSVVTNLAVVDIGPEGFALREVAPGVSVAEVVAATGAPLAVSGEVPTMVLS